MSDDCAVDTTVDPNRSPGAGFVWCSTCGCWYPPTSVHAASTEGTTR